MLRATFKSLLSRKLRLILSALAVVLGVMFVSGAFVLTDTIGRSFESMFTTAYSTLDVQVVSKPRPGRDSQDTAVSKPVPQDLVDRVQQVPGVRKATGAIFVDGARVVDPETGKYLGPGFGVPSFGGNWTGEDNLVKLRSGRGPQADDEVVVNADLAKSGGFEVGSQFEVKVPTLDERQKVKIVGIFGYAGGRGSLTGETTVLFTTPVAQRLLIGQEGVVTEIDVTVADGESPRAVRDRIRAAVGDAYQVKTGKELVKETANAIKEGLKFFNYVLLGFAGVSLFVGVFIILNTFSIIIAQRMRELALMRALGASRSQMLLAVLVEATVIGLIAAVVGLGAGIGVGTLLAMLAGNFVGGLELAGIGVPASAIVSAFAVGVGVTVVAAFLPALRASRVPPIAALQEASTPDRPLTRITLGGGLVTLGGSVALVLGLTGRAGDHTLWTILAGVMVTFVGIALLTPVISRPVVSALGKVFAWSTPGELGRRNTARNPRRTAITAAALMVGVALVTAISTVLSSATTSLDRTLDKELKAQLLVYGVQTGQLPPTFNASVLRQTRELPEVSAVGAMWFDYVQLNGEQAMVAATDDLPALLAVANTAGTAGTVDRLGPGQVVVDDRTAKDRKLTVGSTVRIALSRDDERQFTVVGIYRGNNLASGFITSVDEVSKFRVDDPMQAMIQVRDDADVEAVRDKVEAMLADNPEVSVADRSQFAKQQTDQVDTILVFIQILLALAMIIAVLGVINTLVLSVIERTRELGLLRAVGLSRAQTTRMITVESVVISMFGALLGVAVGAGLGAAVVRALKDQGITTITFPVSLMVTYLLLAALVGVIAAVFPAYRATRLNVLAAIAYE